MRKLTEAEARRIYLTVFPSMRGQHFGSEWADIRDEMQAVLDAPSDRKAGNVIAWWGCWYEDPKDTPTRAARKLRAAGKELFGDE